jgi:hypothetical protein
MAYWNLWKIGIKARLMISTPILIEIIIAIGSKLIPLKVLTNVAVVFILIYFPPVQSS